MLNHQLISSAKQMVRQAKQVTTSLLQHLVEQAEPLLPLIEHVIV